MLLILYVWHEMRQQLVAGQETKFLIKICTILQLFFTAKSKTG